MNKFFAMLKDSYREAVDGWIFLVMLILSGLIILLVLSASVEALPPERAIPVMLHNQSIYVISANRGQAEQQIPCFFRFNGTTVTLNEAKRPWENKMTINAHVMIALPRSGKMDNDGMETVDAQDAMAMMVFKETVKYWNSNGNLLEAPKPYTKAIGEEFLKKQIGEGTGLNVTNVTIVGDNKFLIEADGMKNWKDWPHVPTLFFGAWRIESQADTLGSLVYFIESKLLNGLGAWILMLAGVVVTAGFIPNMLRKGAIDLFITKPISRPTILLYKYLGGLLFVFLLTVFTVGGVWLVIGLRTGVWNTGIFVAIFGITFYFAILYACSTLFGVLSRNTIVCIIVTIVFWFILYIIGTAFNMLSAFDKLDYEGMRQANQTAAKVSKEAEKAKDAEKDKGKTDKDKEKKDNGKKKDEDEEPPPMPDLKPNPTLMKISRGLNDATPRLNDLDALTSQVIAEGLVPDADYKQKARAANNVRWGEALAVSGAWLVFFLGLATLRFVTRSY